MNKRILVIENDRDLLEQCTSILKKSGFEVDSALYLSEARRKFLKNEFGLIIIDFSVSGFDTISFFEELKKEKPEISAILLLSQEPIDVAVRAIEKGFTRLLKKPFSEKELVSAVTESLSRANLIKENIRLKTLIPLYDLGEKFIKAESEEQILKELINAIIENIKADRVSIMLYDEKNGVLRIKMAIGLDQDIIKKVEVKPGERIAGWVFQNKKPLIINDTIDLTDPKIRPFLKRKNIVSAISVPIISIPMYGREKNIGVLNISRTKEKKAFTESEMEMAFVICRQAAMAIENIRAINEKEEKLKIKTILMQYMTPEIAEFIISSQQDPTELGEIKEAVILFADIKNFTPLVQKIPIQTTRYFLNEFFGLLTDIIFKFKGTLNKFVGDATLAIFGFPAIMDKPELAAINAAKEIRDSFCRLKDKWKKKEEAFSNIGIGIGITKGNIFIGNVGSSKRFDFTAIGLDVNLAQRLASDAENGQILISNKVKAYIEEKFLVMEKGPYFLKGIDEPVNIYVVMEEKNGCSEGNK